MTDEHKILSKDSILPFVLVTALFFLWALPNNLNDILIPQFMKSFELSRLQAGLVQSAFYMGYFLLAMPAALIMEKYNYKTGLIIGLLLFATGCFLFWPAASTGRYGFFLFALFIIASGLAFLETGSNSFIAVLGDQATSERRLNLSQSFNPLGSMTGVLIGTVFIFSGTELSNIQIDKMKLDGTYPAYLHEEIMRVGPPYIVIGSIILLLAFLIWKTRFPVEKKATSPDGNNTGKLSALMHYPHFLKGVAAQFFYVGAQVGTWSFMIQYLKDYMQKSEKELTAYHEAGHAITALNCPNSDPIHKATIIPRGRALGLVMRLPEYDRFSVTRAKLKDDLIVAFGGRAAEELIFGYEQVTTGASSDIQQATSMARAMVTKWGLSDKVGAIDYGEDDVSRFYAANKP